MIPGFRNLHWCALAACVAFSTGATAARGEDPAASAALFLRVCSACHGERGDGKSLASAALKTTPRDFTTEQARTSLSREYMIAIVRDGRPHTAMVGRSVRLTQAEIEGVVDFIRTAFMPPEPGSPLAQGRAIYRTSCASCHGDRGQGRARRGAMAPAPPISPARARSGLGAGEMVEAILRQEHAPELALTAGEAQSVAAYVRTTFIETAAGRRATGAPRAE
jgi:mono/diheme cytochrome c family protein